MWAPEMLSHFILPHPGFGLVNLLKLIRSKKEENKGFKARPECFLITMATLRCTPCGFSPSLFLETCSPKTA